MSDENGFRKIDLNLLLVFEAIYKTGNISLAAKQLGLSQPTVSNAISRLRTQLGDQLFTRQDRGVTPTTFAETIITPVRQALSMLRSGLQQHTAFDYEHAQRVFRIAAHGFTLHAVLPALLDELNIKAPGIKLEIHTPDWNKPFEGLLSGETDLLLDTLSHEDAQIHFEPLFNLQTVAIARRGHPLIDGALTAEAFVTAGHVVLAAPIRRSIQIDSALASAGLRRRIVCEVQHSADLGPMVAQTDLIALVPLRYALAAADLLNLQVLQIPFRFPVLKVMQAWVYQKDNDAGLQWLRARIRKAVEATDTPLLPAHPAWASETDSKEPLLEPSA